MPTCASLPPAQARQAWAGTNQMSRELQELVATIPLILAQLRLYPDPQFFLQVVTGLTTLQTAVSDLLRSYLKHTNSVLGSTPYRLDTFGISNPLNNNEILAGALRDSPFVAAQPAAAVPSAEEEPAKKGRKPKKEKKEKKEKDPNEPKRPLTIYFLFSAHARPIVKGDLGEKASKGEVEEEIKKRWRELSDDEKAVSINPVQHGLADLELTFATGLEGYLRQEPRDLPREDGGVQGHQGARCPSGCRDARYR